MPPGRIKVSFHLEPTIDLTDLDKLQIITHRDGNKFLCSCLIKVSEKGFSPAEDNFCPQGMRFQDLCYTALPCQTSIVSEFRYQVRYRYNLYLVKMGHGCNVAQTVRGSANTFQAGEFHKNYEFLEHCKYSQLFREGNSDDCRYTYL